MDGFFCKQRTVYFYRRQSVQSFHNGFVGNLHCFLDIFAFYQFGCHAAGCNGCSASKGFKFYIADDPVIVNVQINTHDIAAFCIADGSDTTCIFDFAYITRMIKISSNFLFCFSIFILAYFLTISVLCTI